MPTPESTGKCIDMEQDILNTEQIGQERVINSGDRLTIETIAAFAQEIRDGLAQAETVVIEFAAEVELDITALQLFCSACKTATATGKKFIHRGPLPQSLLSLTLAAGSESQEQHCNNNSTCFRMFGGMP